VSSIGKSFDWNWNPSDDTGGASDADTEPDDDVDVDVDVDEQEVQEMQEEQQQQGELEPEPEPEQQQPPPMSENTSTSFGFHGFHSFGSPLSSSQTPKNNALDLTAYTHNLHFSTLVPRMTTITSSPQSPVHSRPISPFVSPFVSPNVSRAPSSAGSTTSSRFRRRSSQKRISLIAGRISYTPPPSPPLVDTDLDDQEHAHHDHDHQPSPRLLRLNSTSSFMSLASTVATAPPTPAAGPGTAHAGDYLGERSISEFVIQGDVGRGAYGLVKRGREVMSNGSYGVRPFSSKKNFFTRCGSFGLIAPAHHLGWACALRSCGGAA
jgi:protein-serine/threonine kinase